MVTSSVVASKGATDSGTVPAAEMMRPQLGSPPKTAALNRLERATARPTASAACLGGRADDGDGDVVGRALGVGNEAARDLAHTRRVSAASKSPVTRRDARRSAHHEQHGVVGRHAAIGVDAIEGGADGLRERGVRRPASITASVVMTHSIVASPGASMPAPLAMPPTTQPFARHGRLLGDRVGGEDRVGSVVAAVRGKRRRSSVDALRTACPCGNRTPMSPVEQTATSPAETSPWPGEHLRDLLRGAVGVREAVRARGGVRAAGVEDDGVDAAVGRPPGGTMRRERRTTRLVVNTAAATWSGPSLTTSATSGRPEALRPAVTPAATNPAAAVTLMARLR